jgi:hypothetical protein
MDILRQSGILCLPVSGLPYVLSCKKSANVADAHFVYRKKLLQIEKCYSYLFNIKFFKDTKFHSGEVKDVYRKDWQLCTFYVVGN